jgi:uncharacterized protein
MEISGSHRIPAPRRAVWAALHDPDVLKACLPGCERLERGSDGVFDGEVSAKVGPLKARFAGRVTVTASSPPERVAFSVSGSDPSAGSGEGSGELTLEEDGDGTLARYAGQAEVAGKLAQLGSRLVSGVARQSADSFFGALADLAAEGRLPASPSNEPPLAEAPPLAPDAPVAGPADVLDAPPLASVSPAAKAGLAPTPIAPTAAPDVPDPAAIAAAETASGAGNGFTTVKVGLVAAVLAAAAVALYFATAATPV